MNSACILQIVAGVIIIIGAIIGLVFYFAAADSAKETCKYDIDPDGCEVGTYKTHNNNNTHTHTHTHAIDPSEVFEVDTHKDPQQQRTPTQCDPSGDCEVIINHQYMKGHNNNVGAAHSYRMQPCQLPTHPTTPLLHLLDFCQNTKKRSCHYFLSACLALPSLPHRLRDRTARGSLSRILVCRSLVC